MIADSLITPPISVMSAMEGLVVINRGIPILPITIGILVLLFLFQQSGTNKIGKLFGPAMVIWFSMIAILGVINLADNWTVLRAVNPLYAYRLVVAYPGGLWILGGVFLCTTGAEALYADMGHVGRHNIQIAWIFIKLSLLLCYFGEAALLLKYEGRSISSVDAFYGLMPSWFLVPGIAIATAATIIASQALISGTFTLFNEAIRLDIFPKLRIEFPTDMRGQVYVPGVNWAMMGGCIGMVLYFRKSANMEAAFGLSVTLTMLMTTVLLAYYLYTRRVSLWIVGGVTLLFLWIEVTFLVANLSKFAHGGWLTLLIGTLLVATMYVWFAGKKLKVRYKKMVWLKKFQAQLQELSNDLTVSKYATHLVYLTGSANSERIEERIIDSILYQRPKRADLYWFVHVEVIDEPYHAGYSVDIITPEEIVYVKFRLGFRVVPRVNLLFKKVVNEMIANNEISIADKYHTVEKNYISGDFRFVVLKSFLSVENNLPFFNNLLMRLHFLLDNISLSDDKAYGLDYINVVVERVPLVLGVCTDIQLIREG